MRTRLWNTVALSLAGLLIAVSTPVSAESLHDDYDALLERYVVDDRWVDYAAWFRSDEDRARLQNYLDQMATADPATLGRDGTLAYWINLYNALTLDLILDHYPVGSIKDLGGLLTSAWEKELVEVAGRAFTLNQIENDVIRRRFEDPRIHFALNCAAFSCPPLAGFAFTADQLDEQLERVTRRALRDPTWVDPSRCRTYGKGTIRLSKIFDWYADDFGGEAGIRGFLARYLPEAELPLQNEGCSLDYLDYDWSLNLPPDERSPE